ncbi:hypothetical protein EOPP23_17575 [Endozoicomonas sp. OPT23]|uniref:hypothetical protein n=1 Tax=Endozoicomonas sp. OPT23 TaxID=2072845 RepID=UPI00129A5E37|nr:hypothetical protein [Endozoicomonas sp. OPT23]MRI34794.1 hypothetical protein [Endozoicomonas sp. OPT23]
MSTPIAASQPTWFQNKLEAFKTSTIGKFLGKTISALNFARNSIARTCGNFIQKQVLNRPCMRWADSKNYVRKEKLLKANDEIGGLKDDNNVLKVQVKGLEDVNSMLVHQRDGALKQVKFLRLGAEQIQGTLAYMLKNTVPVAIS